MFENAKKQSPCIIFIDEIDAVGRQRGAGLGGGNDEREQTLNQLLVEMDGFESGVGVIVIAATNRPDVLDPALLRPGRFDRQIVVDAPDLRGREGILKVHLRNKPQADDVSVHSLARGTPGMAGADLANLVNEGALLAARKGHDKIFMSDLEEAKDRVMLGAERKSLVMKDDERRLTAFHEAGHAVCAMMVYGNDPLHKVTIVPRGRALGIAFTLPEDDRVSVTREQLEAKLVMAYGGRAAEEIVFGHNRVTTAPPCHYRLISIEGQAAFLVIGVVTRGAMLAQDRLDVIVERDLGRLFPNGWQTRDGYERSRYQFLLHDGLVIENELSAVEHGPEDVLQSLIRIGSFGNGLFQAGRFQLRRLSSKTTNVDFLDDLILAEPLILPRFQQPTLSNFATGGIAIDQVQCLRERRIGRCFVCANRCALAATERCQEVIACRSVCDLHCTCTLR